MFATEMDYTLSAIETGSPVTFKAKKLDLKTTMELDEWFRRYLLLKLMREDGLDHDQAVKYLGDTSFFDKTNPWGVPSKVRIVRFAWAVSGTQMSYADFFETFFNNKVGENTARQLAIMEKNSDTASDVMTFSCLDPTQPPQPEAATRETPTPDGSPAAPESSATSQDSTE